MRITWNEVLERDDIIGGDIELQAGGIVYRGPIESITLIGSMVTLKPSWLARLNPSTFGWEKCDASEQFVDAEAFPPHDIGNGRILFGADSRGGVTTLFPKGNNLDPSAVDGLEFKKVDKNVTELHKNCSYPMSADAVAASDNCGSPALTAVVDPDTGNRYYRCHEHRGFLRDDVRGEVVDTVSVLTDEILV